MSKITFATHPFLLGFDHFDQLVENTIKASNQSYPPYNIEVLSSSQYRITLAIAGFRERDIEITTEDNQLNIVGRQPVSSEEREFLHRGIATRQFQRRFVLADGVKITLAELEHGLLHIELEKEQRDKMSQTIKIVSK